MRDDRTNGVYLWTDEGQFGAWLTEAEEEALTRVFDYFPVTDVRWTTFVYFRPTGLGTEVGASRRAMVIKEAFLSAMTKLGTRAIGRPFDWEEIRQWVQPGNVWSVSRDHDARGRVRS